MVTLRNVVDIRTGQFYSIVRVKSNKARFFQEIVEEEEEKEE
jgi:hypothetical protein